MTRSFVADDHALWLWVACAGDADICANAGDGDIHRAADRDSHARAANIHADSHSDDACANARATFGHAEAGFTDAQASFGYAHGPCLH